VRLPGEMLCGQHLTKAPISLRNCPHSFSTVTLGGRYGTQEAGLDHVWVIAACWADPVSRHRPCVTPPSRVTPPTRPH